MFKVNYSPHVRDEDNTRILMSTVLVALLPALIAACFYFGMRSLVITLAAVTACVASEAVFNLLMKKPQTIGDLSAVVTGLLLAFNLPVSVPLWMPAVGGAFAIIIVKMLFGGIGRNFMNPALAARAFLFSWPGEMTTWPKPFSNLPLFSNLTSADIDAVVTVTPLKELKKGTFDFSNLMNLFTGNIGGCIGEVSAVLLILGGLFLLARKVITWHIPFSFIGTVALYYFIFNNNNPRLEYMTAQLLAGGLMLGAFYMATDYATSPVTSWGKIIFGVGCGLITVFIRSFGGYPEGVSFAILIMNAFVWVLDKKTRPRRYGTGGAAHV